MDDKTQKALDCFDSGFSCSQAVLSAYCDYFNLDRETALRISQPFGGGIAHQGETCGAISGAFLVLGLKFGRIHAEDLESRDNTYSKILEFTQRFSAENGSTLCKELLGYDMSLPGEFEKAEAAAVFDTICPKLIRSSMEILEQMLTAQ